MPRDGVLRRQRQPFDAPGRASKKIRASPAHPGDEAPSEPARGVLHQLSAGEVQQRDNCSAEGREAPPKPTASASASRAHRLTSAAGTSPPEEGGFGGDRTTFQGTHADAQDSAYAQGEETFDSNATTEPPSPSPPRVQAPEREDSRGVITETLDPSGVVNLVTPPFRGQRFTREQLRTCITEIMHFGSDRQGFSMKQPTDADGPGYSVCLGKGVFYNATQLRSMLARARIRPLDGRDAFSFDEVKHVFDKLQNQRNKVIKFLQDAVVAHARPATGLGAPPQESDSESDEDLDFFDDATHESASDKNRGRSLVAIKGKVLPAPVLEAFALEDPERLRLVESTELEKELEHLFTILKVPENLPAVNTKKPKPNYLCSQAIALEGGRALDKADNLKAFRLSIAYEARRRGKATSRKEKARGGGKEDDKNMEWALDPTLILALHEYASLQVFDSPAILVHDRTGTITVQLEGGRLAATAVLVAALMDLHGATKIGTNFVLGIRSMIKAAGRPVRSDDVVVTANFIANILGRTSKDCEDTGDAEEPSEEQLARLQDLQDAGI